MSQTPYHAATNDSLLDTCWYLKRANVFHAWKYGRGGNAIKFGIADTGVMAHVDLKLPANHNVFPGDVTFKGVSGLSHGSGCWATATGKANNGIGVSGVAPDAAADFYVFNSQYPDNISDFLGAIDNANFSGAKILSISWGPYAYSVGNTLGLTPDLDATTDPQYTECRQALHDYVAAGGMLCLCGGNTMYNLPVDARFAFATWEPQATLLVGYFDENENSRDSSTGEDISICGGGYHLNLPKYTFGATDANPGTAYQYYDGLSSWTTPQVAAVASLVGNINPSLTGTQITKLLKDTSHKSYLSGNFNEHFPKAGILDAGKAVKKALSTVTANAGQVYPYLGMYGSGVTTTITDGVATTSLNGSVVLDVTAFSNLAITKVELFVGNRLLYSGAPAILKAPSATCSGTTGQLTITAYTANGSSSETYTDILVDNTLQVQEPYNHITNDSLLNQAWHLKRMNLFHAWKYTKGNSSAKVLVMDTGLARTNGTTVHPDIPAPDYEWDASTEFTDTYPGLADEKSAGKSHGTSVWAHLKSPANNEEGVAGVAPDCWGAFASLVDSEGSSNYAAWLDCFYKARDVLGIKIISNSAAFPAMTRVNNTQNPADALAYPEFKAAMDYFMAGGGLIFAASPYANSYMDAPNHVVGNIADEVCVPGVIAVAGVAGIDASSYDDPRKNIVAWNAASYGPGIEIVSPSADTYAAYGWNSRFQIEQGVPLTWPAYVYGGAYPTPSVDHHPSSSYSTPQVAGVAALIWSANPALTGAEVRSILTSTADVGRHVDYASRYPNAGIVNAGKAVKKSLSTVAANAGVVYPYVGFSGPNITTNIAQGLSTTTANGSFEVDLAGFSSDAITSVEFWVGNTKIYDGVPARITLSNSGTGNPVTVVAKTANSSSSESYYDISLGAVSGASVGFSGTADITNRPNSISASGSLSIQPASGNIAKTQAINTVSASGSYTADSVTSTPHIAQAHNSIQANGLFVLGVVGGVAHLSNSINTVSLSGAFVARPVTGLIVASQAKEIAHSSGLFVPKAVSGVIDVVQAPNKSWIATQSIVQVWNGNAWVTSEVWSWTGTAWKQMESKHFK